MHKPDPKRVMRQQCHVCIQAYTSDTDLGETTDEACVARVGDVQHFCPPLSVLLGPFLHF